MFFKLFLHKKGKFMLIAVELGLLTDDILSLTEMLYDDYYNSFYENNFSFLVKQSKLCFYILTVSYI